MPNNIPQPGKTPRLVSRWDKLSPGERSRQIAALRAQVKRTTSQETKGEEQTESPGGEAKG